MVKAIKLSGIVIVLTFLLAALTACNDTPTSTLTFTPTNISWDIAARGVLLRDIDLASPDMR